MSATGVLASHLRHDAMHEVVALQECSCQKETRRLHVPQAVASLLESCTCRLSAGTECLYVWLDSSSAATNTAAQRSERSFDKISIGTRSSRTLCLLQQ